MGKTISVTLDQEEQEMLEILKEYDHRKNNPDMVRALIAQGYSRIKKDKRSELKELLIEKGVLLIEGGKA